MHFCTLISLGQALLLVPGEDIGFPQSLWPLHLFESYDININIFCKARALKCTYLIRLHGFYTQQRRMGMYEGQPKKVAAWESEGCLRNGLDWFQGLPLINVCYIPQHIKAGLHFRPVWVYFNPGSYGFHRYRSYCELKYSFPHMFPFHIGSKEILFLNM